jgi:uncharacterized protein YbjT (DUF2867 family)
MILVSGAAGKTGQAVTRALLKREATVRAFVYRAEQTKLVEALGVHQTVVGDMRDEVAFRQATQGVTAMYHVCSNMNPAEVSIGQTAITAAGEAGVRHFVYHSVLHPQIEAMPHHWNKSRVEEMLFESGLDFTILQPAAYMQNILVGWPTIVNQGVFRVPYPTETRLGLVDLEDVASVVATVLTEPGHIGAIYELAGPDILSQTEVAVILGECLARSVKVEQLPLDQWIEQARASGLGSYQVETLVKMFRYYEQYDFWGNSQVLSWLLKRPATGFRAFVERVRLELRA